MERLTADVTGMIGHVRSLPPNPSPEQVNSKVLTLYDAVIKDALALPIRIQEIIQEAFLVVGFNYQSKKVFDKSKLSVDNLLVCLQTISDEIHNWSPPVTPTAEELGSLSLACSKLWDLDHNRLSPGIDYLINIQQGKKAYDSGDVAPDNFFTFVREEVFQRPTYKAFLALFDNYNPDIGESEVVTKEELSENNLFLKLAMDTAVMQYVHQYLLLTNKTTKQDRKEFIQEMEKLWFGLYSRKAKNDSSGFEHVFIGEIKNGTEVVGFHNWIRIFTEEKMKRFNYLGYIKPKKRGLSNDRPDEFEQMISMQFDWLGAKKLVSTSLIGTSPEFELALYTLCFFSGQQENIVQLGPYRVLMTSYTWPPTPRPGQPIYIATSFPSDASN